MNAETYPVIALEGYTRFEFLSEGPKGTIKKVVHYQLMAGRVFNLAFGDWDEEKGTISDLVRSNNNDRDKVLATVAFTLIEFMEHCSDAIVMAQGATPARTRLYQMGIKNNWVEISLLFCIKRLRDGVWSDFNPTKNYEAFSATAKKKFRFVRVKFTAHE